MTYKEKSTLTFSYKGIQNIEITSSMFEKESESLMDRTMFLIDEALDLASMEISDIEEIIMVGGSSRMPMVKRLVADKFRKDPKLIDPDLAVAKGAALTASQIEKGFVEGALTMGHDKGTRAYGMATYVDDNECVCNLIMRNDNLEIRKEFDNFSTRSNGQTCLNFRFYESECADEYMDINPDLQIKGRNDEISWGSPVPAGTPIKIVVERDRSGIIKVYAECQGARGEFEIVSPGCGSHRR